MEEKQDTGNLRDFLAIVFKYKSKILTIFFAVVIVVTVLSFVLPPTYEAKSSLLVKFGREYIYQPEVGDRAPQITISSTSAQQEEILNSEIKILTNHDLMKKVIETVEVEKLYPNLVKTYRGGITPLDKAILQFEQALKVEGVKKSNVIEVAYRHKDPLMAAKVTNLLVELFKEKHLQVYSDPKSSFLEGQLAEYNHKLQDSENKLQQFKQNYHVYSLDEQRNLLLKQRVDLDTAFKGTQSMIRELQQKLFSLKSQQKAIMEGTTLYTPSELDRMLNETKAKLLGLQLQEQELLLKYKENNRFVENVRKEIHITKAFLAEQEAYVQTKIRTGSPVYQEVENNKIKAEADLMAQEAKGESIKRQVEQMDREIRTLDLREKEFQNFKRDAATNEKNYKNYLDKFEEARISDDMNRRKMSNVSIIEAAAVPVEPVKPKKLLNIALSIVLGAVAGLGFAFFSEHAGQTISTPQSAERQLGMRLLAAIPLKT